MSIVDHPQEIHDKRLNWLGGFFDAEGGASFSEGHAQLSINNTCSMSILQIQQILQDYKVEINLLVRHDLRKKETSKLRQDINIGRNEFSRKFISLMDKYVYGKHKQFEILESEHFAKGIDVAERIKFANHVHNFIIVEIDKIKQKLSSDNLHKYADINVLTEEDKTIITYENFDDLDYLAGLFDGEGTLVLHQRKNKHRPNSSYERFTPQVLFTNTNKEIIKRYCSVLKNNNIGYLICFRSGTNRKRWDIIISGVKRCHTMLQLIRPHLVTKQKQANLLCEYCRYRLSEPKNKNEIGISTKRTLESMR